MNHLSNDQLNLLLDDKLDPGERTRAQAHLDECSDCRAELAALQRVEYLLDAVVDEPLQADLTECVLALAAPVRLPAWTGALVAAQIAAAGALSIWLAPSLIGTLAFANEAVSELNGLVEGFSALVNQTTLLLDALDLAAFQNIAPLEWLLVAVLALSMWLFANRILIVNSERNFA
jgi:hypothetical protein